MATWLSISYTVKEPFVDGRACVKRGKWGYIDKTGAEVVPRKYKFAANFGYANNNKAYTYVSLIDNFEYFYIDEFGNRLSDKVYAGAYHFDHKTGLAAVEGMDHKHGYIDTDGDEIVPPIYDAVWSKFDDDGMARVELNDKIGYIDVTGKFVIPCIYDKVSDLGIFDKNGHLEVEIDHDRFYINRKGEKVKP